MQSDLREAHNFKKSVFVIKTKKKEIKWMKKIFLKKLFIKIKYIGSNVVIWQKYD